MSDEQPEEPRPRTFALESIWDREVTKFARRVAMAAFAGAYVVFISVAISWAHHQSYETTGYLMCIAAAMVAVWLLVLLVLIGIAVADFRAHR